MDKPVRPASEVDIQAAICFYGDRRVQKALHNSDDNQRRVDAELAYIMGLFEARDAEVREEAELPWRKALWLLHGHHGLYGDDGEMQCSFCMPRDGDYKRGTADDVIAAATKAWQQVLAKRIAEVRAAALEEAEKLWVQYGGDRQFLECIWDLATRSTEEPTK